MAKKNYISSLFNRIATNYDSLNHILSLSIDKRWRKIAVKEIVKHTQKTVLDVACGTADLSIALAKAGVNKVVGIDIAEGMIAIGKKKITKQNLSEKIELQYGDCERMDFDDNSFDAVTVAFGVRNLENLQNGLKEMRRVVKENGIIIILELSVPENKLLFFFYNLYFKYIVPFIGGLISKDKSAYTYLYTSVLHFPKPAQFMQKLQAAGFSSVQHTAFSFGLARMYVAHK
ncbi:MAG: bifunctional demethylmenaquinone methyltransferase/2-methoxy-6-polyprenyl-1,4-benzoquinol methylase UbiE [Paludibacteraceae bacterium]|nr:bifunctional demethylmenaquinone methyltransferase/2-methoxy-6-polyprenyl-1,4-benzoquinol methylase UbiE [Paludibacteraceae bacterium]MBP6284788.1 bifunctional demethylmenaquinone methyltransferase/2-methoxy-6-polyprenyl-1,4-benzoquinol methylase UbiE [Paludibacteraceae bacterium]